ncbi:hypothetical protein EZV73_21380 [Acidaminobacter sp. JC074]|uniref:DJ-1/PfpI family protein n=1 Tax=Acidaminobacter sp. JC074 TaxID=2530199 RepID=UPI001F0D21CE|nr:DJ-1/PfpI family protein [Acidaminobacter sp. JC074]MCH4890147.1 hypothetical protein [Acidaminobacter sp. JC074]
MKIGYLLLEGFSNGDVIGSQAVLAFSKSKFYYIGKEEKMLLGDSQYSLRTNTTLKSCPKLDVLIIPGLKEETLTEEILDFIRLQAKSCKHVLAFSSGVLALAKTGILKNRYVTADKKTLQRLEAFGARPVNRKTFMKDHKFITAGPSTGVIEAAYYLVYLERGKGLTKLLELNLEYNPTKAFDHIDQRELPDIDYKPLRVGVTCPDKLYMPDVAGAVDVFKNIPNAEIYYVWKEYGQMTSILGPDTEVTMTFKESPQFDVLITGAIAPGATVDDDLINFYRSQSKGAKAVVGVCAGVFVLGAAGLLENRMSVTNLHMLSMLKKVGAKRHNTETTVDGKYFTAGPAIGSYEIALQVVAQIYGEPLAAYLESEVLEYHPNPIFDMGTPKKAGKIRHMMSLCLSTPLLPLYGGKVKRAYKTNKTLL